MSDGANNGDEGHFKNIIKTRDDIKPISFTVDNDVEDISKKFVLDEDAACFWAKPGDSFGPDKLRPRIEPWLTALCQSEHLSLLLGSGLTHSVHRLATDAALPGMDSGDFGKFNDVINAEAKRSAKKCGRGEGNIEDQIHAANELLRGLEILGSSNKRTKKQADTLRKTLTNVLTFFSNSVFKGERNLINADVAKREQAFNYLVSFMMSFASRTGTRDRLNIFTTNYDRFIEAGAEVAGMHLLDRFVGTLSPIFRSSRLDLDMHYNPPGMRGEPRYLEGVARFTKLHGSVDWVDCIQSIRRIAFPFGADSIQPYIAASGIKEANSMQLIVYPNAAKDRETAFYPYVELFRDFAAAACRPNHTLIAFGYSFGDEHINRVIGDMLTIPSTHLVVMSYDDPLNRIMQTYESLGRPAQISLLIGNHIGELQSLVDNYLPKPAIDRTTFRMAELLKARFVTKQSESHDPMGTDTTGEGGDV